MNNIIKRISNPTLDKRCNILVSIIYYSDGTKRKTSTCRAIMEQHLNRKLKSNEFIIYKDGNSLNIELNNLELISKDEFKKYMIKNNKIYYNNSDKKSKIHTNLILDYFKEINTKDKAYWLGFLFADGCLINKHYRLRYGCIDKKWFDGSIASGSEKFLEDIKELLSINNKISKRKNSNTFVLYISKKVIQELNDNYPDSMARKRIDFYHSN